MSDVCATLDAAKYGNGQADASGAIQTAIDHCLDGGKPSGAVHIPAGTYVL